MLKLSEMDQFGPKTVNTFCLFFKSVREVFLKLHLMTDTNEWVRVIVLDFKGKLILLWEKRVRY